MSKPTGDAECPPAVERAHEIEDLMNERIASRELDDDEIADFAEDEDGADEESEAGEDEDEEEVIEKPVTKKVKVRAVKTETPIPSRIPSAATAVPCRPRQSAGMEVLAQISNSINPATQASRDADRAAQSFQGQQLFMLNSQIRDLNNVVADLRTQLIESERRRNDADRQTDRVQHQLELARMMNDLTSSRGRSRSRSAIPSLEGPRPRPRRSHPRRSESHSRDSRSRRSNHRTHRSHHPRLHGSRHRTHRTPSSHSSESRSTSEEREYQRLAAQRWEVIYPGGGRAQFSGPVDAFEGEQYGDLDRSPRTYRQLEPIREPTPPPPPVISRHAARVVTPPPSQPRHVINMYITPSRGQDISIHSSPQAHTSFEEPCDYSDNSGDELPANWEPTPPRHKP
jgi:hypothetical protein